MNLLRSIRHMVIALSLALLVFTTACSSSSVQSKSPASLPTGAYAQIERGDTTSGQNFGNWVVQTASGLVSDAYVRDNDKLGVVISPQVAPRDVKTLAKSLLQGFQKNFPHRDLTVLVYAPDKELILTAKYNDSTRMIEYNS
ncbi:MAG: hypothetical protein ACTS2F_19150 [Thainema sp.]